MTLLPSLYYSLTTTAGQLGAAIRSPLGDLYVNPLGDPSIHRTRNLSKHDNAIFFNRLFMFLITEPTILSNMPMCSMSSESKTL